MSHPQLHQRWVGDGYGGFDPTPNTFSLSNGDSHLVAAVALFGSGPAEDNSGAGSPLADTSLNDYGLGTALNGAWGTQIESATPLQAYVVIPKGTEHLLDIRAKSTSATASGPLGDLTEADFLPVAPTLRVDGNGLEIASGDTSPRPEDGTDFGLDGLGETERRTFEIKNTSLVPLALGPPTLTGPFELEGGAFPDTILPGASASFNVLMHRDSPGSFAGSIGFGTNAVRYEFSLAGQVVPEPTTVILLTLTLISWGFVRRSHGI